MTKRDELPPEHVSAFIDQVLKAKDPATVGLKKILHRQEERKNDYPVRSEELEMFAESGGGEKKLSAEDRHVLELEKKVADLQITLRQQNEKSVAAVQAAYAKGKKEGREAGREEGMKTAGEVYEKKTDLLQQRFEQMFHDLETSKKMMFHHAEHLLVQLCCEMVKKIIYTEVEEHRDIVLSVVKHAVGYVGHHEKMVVRVAPGDLETITNRKDFWIPVGERLNDITIEADERITPGGCILESNTGLVDARLGVQIRELADLVEKTWNDIHTALVAGVDDVPV